MEASLYQSLHFAVNRFPQARIVEDRSVVPEQILR